MKVQSTLILSVIFLCTSCSIFRVCEKPTGDVITKDLKLENIHSIELSAGVKVFIQQGEDQNIKIVAPANYAELINTNVSKGEWEIDFKKCLKNADLVELFVVLKEIEELEINGSGNIIGNGVIESNKLELEISGSGSIQLELDNKSVDLEIDGSGDIILSGKTKKQKIEINGSGDINNSKLTADESKIEINGSGDVKINTTSSLEVEVNGSGDVHYTGEPKQIKTEFNGSGRLHKLD